MLKRLVIAGLVVALLVPAVGAGRRNPIRDTVWGSTLVTTVSEHVSGRPWTYFSVKFFSTAYGYVVFTTSSGRSDTLRFNPNDAYTTDGEFDTVEIHRALSSDTISYEVSMD